MRKVAEKREEASMARDGEEKLTGEGRSLFGFPWLRCLSRRRDVAAKLRGAAEASAARRAKAW